jgi:hypothetical protein
MKQYLIMFIIVFAAVAVAMTVNKNVGFKLKA